MNGIVCVVRSQLVFVPKLDHMLTGLRQADICLDIWRLLAVIRNKLLSVSAFPVSALRLFSSNAGLAIESLLSQNRASVCLRIYCTDKD
ncbi:MAG: hypothetical protein RQ899_05205 [Pseudomonadales bacterium]|nr:hypothetical protein [Pseudomonadales bacterium]